MRRGVKDSGDVGPDWRSRKVDEQVFGPDLWCLFSLHLLFWRISKEEETTPRKRKPKTLATTSSRFTQICQCPVHTFQPIFRNMWRAMPYPVLTIFLLVLNLSWPLSPIMFDPILTQLNNVKLGQDGGWYRTRKCQMGSGSDAARIGPEKGWMR